jgi:hypothetical protein
MDLRSKELHSDAFGLSPVKCPWGLETVDPATLLSEAASTLAPLNYHPQAAEAPKKVLMRLPKPFRKVASRLARSASGDATLHIWSMQRKSPPPPPGWLNAFNVRTDYENNPSPWGNLALPIELKAGLRDSDALTERFPKPDYSASPPAPPRGSVQGGVSQEILAAPSVRAHADVTSQSMSLSNFSLAQSSNSMFFGNSNSTLTLPDTGNLWQASSTNLVHPAHRVVGDGATHSTEVYEAPGPHALGLTSASISRDTGSHRGADSEAVTRSSEHASLHDDVDEGGAYKPSPTALGFSPNFPIGNLRGPSTGLVASRGLVRGPSTIPEHPEGSLDDDPSAENGMPQLSASRLSLASPVSSSTGLAVREFSVQEVPGLVEAREQNLSETAIAAAAQVRRIAQAVTNVQALQIDSALLGKYRCVILNLLDVTVAPVWHCGYLLQ